jgi:Flp pilus assembly pilin Flp
MANQSVGPTTSRIVKALRKLLCGSSLGQAAVEYTAVVGSCAVVCLAAADRLGDAVHGDLRATAEHLEGRGMPDLVNPLEALPHALANDDDGEDRDDDGSGEGPLGVGDGDAQEEEDEKEEERICGVTGSYGELKKGALPNYSDGDTYSLDQTLDEKEYKHKYERDHIPGKHALKIRARANTEGRIADELRSRCPEIEEDDLAALTAKAAGRLDFRRAGDEIDNTGLTVVMPTEMHKKWSRTQGNKSKRTAAGDAGNLASAEVEDIESYRVWLEEYLAKDDNVSDDEDKRFRDTRCAEQILAALDSFPSPRPGEDARDFEARRNAEYDRMLNEAVDRALGASAIPNAVDDTIEQTPLPDYCN